MPSQVEASTPDPMIGRLLAGRYRVESLIAEGGTGRVYRAVQEALGRRVAVKITHAVPADPTMAANVAERFVREAALAGALQHPNVVTIHDFGHVDDGRAFIVMELLEGKDLSKILRRGPLDPEAALELFQPILWGLRAAHRAGLVHRDMKPANVMVVTEDDGHKTVKVLDFGLVKDTRRAEAAAPAAPEGDADPELTQMGMFLGTPQYVAPEQARGEEPDARTDIYAVGVMLYRALTGVLPFEGPDSATLVNAHLVGSVPPMISRAPGVQVPATLEAVVQRCLEKDRNDRYPDVDALLDALRRARTWAPPTLLPPDESNLDVEEDAEAATLLLMAPAPAPDPLRAPIVPPTEAEAVEQPPSKRRGLAPLVALALVVFGLGVSLVGGAVVMGYQWRTAAEPADVTSSVRAAGPPPTPEPEPVVDLEPEPVAPPVSAPPATAPPKPAPKVEGPKVEAPKVEAPKVEGPKVEAPKVEAPKPPPPPPATGDVVADGVRFTAAQAAAATAFINTASYEQLLAAGVAPRQVAIILEQRPFADMIAFAATPFIGEKTVEAARRGGGG
jgi:serine/threonine-protein kinase